MDRRNFVRAFLGGAILAVPVASVLANGRRSVSSPTFHLYDDRGRCRGVYLLPPPDESQSGMVFAQGLPIVLKADRTITVAAWAIYCDGERQFSGEFTNGPYSLASGDEFHVCGVRIG